MHPLVADDKHQFLKTTDKKIVVLDIPLLFETGADKAVDFVVVVTVSEEEQRRRVLSRNGMSAEMFDIIKSKQTPDDEKRERADIVICTSTLEGAESAVHDVIRQIKNRHNNAGNRS